MKYLIVVDMQVDFITGALGSRDAEAIVPRVLDISRREREGIFPSSIACAARRGTRYAPSFVRTPSA